MANRIAKREFGFWMRQDCPSEIKRCLGTFVKSRGFKGARGLIEKLYQHDHTLPKDGKEYAIAMLDQMREDKRKEQLMVKAATAPLGALPEAV